MVASMWRGALAIAIAIATLLPCAAMAQQPARVFRVGWLMLGSPREAQAGFPGIFLLELQKYGYVEGQNLVVERRSAAFDAGRLNELADDLVHSNVDVIVAFTHQAGIPAKNASRTLPIVVWAMHDAVALGLVRTLARPGTNVTGVESMAPDMDPKRVQLLKEFAPNLKRLGVLYNPEDPSASLHLHSLRAAGLALGVTLELLPIRRPADLEEVLAPTHLEAIDGLFVMTDEVTGARRNVIAEIARRARLPTVCEFRVFAIFGCMISYGPAADEITRLAAAQVDRILKGAKPADLPVQQVTRLELVLNAKTAAAIGVSVPRLMLQRVDDVIE